MIEVTMIESAIVAAAVGFDLIQTEKFAPAEVAHSRIASAVRKFSCILATAILSDDGFSRAADIQRGTQCLDLLRSPSDGVHPKDERRRTSPKFAPAIR